jgi:uncharacterized protein involved in exopolysaccharide biosynthesis
VDGGVDDPLQHRHLGGGSEFVLMAEPLNSGSIRPLVRGYFVPVVDPGGERPVTLAELLGALRARWALILTLTLISTAIGLTAAVFMTKRYDAAVVLMPMADSQSAGALGGMLSQFGGIASLAGVSLGDDSLQKEAYATLVSRAFTEDFIREKSLMPVLFENRWDAAAKDWRPSVWRYEPTLADGFERFNRKIRRVDQDRRTGMVTITIRWKDPDLAAAWANDLVERLNTRLREQAVRDFRRNIQHLKGEFDKTQVVALRESIASVMESEIRREMLAVARPDYAFRVIDPAVPAPLHKFVSPNQKLLVALSFGGGLLLGVLIVISMHLYRREQVRRD